MVILYLLLFGALSSSAVTDEEHNAAISSLQKQYVTLQVKHDNLSNEHNETKQTLEAMQQAIAELKIKQTSLEHGNGLLSGLNAKLHSGYANFTAQHADKLNALKEHVNGVHNTLMGHINGIKERITGKQATIADKPADVVKH